MKKILVSIAVLASLCLNAQQSSEDAKAVTKRPDNWFNLDPATDHVNGVSTEKTYSELLKDKKSTTVIVAVLDSGVDFDHEDLKDVMWTNSGEIPNNGIDDDKNGYVDDIHGWNFLGGKDGRNVECENLESTRLLRKLKPKYEGKTEADLKTKEEKNEYKLYTQVKANYESTKERFEGSYNKVKFLHEGISALNKKIKEKENIEKVDAPTLEKFEPADRSDKQMKMFAYAMLMSDKKSSVDDVLEKLNESLNQLRPYVECGLNLDFDPRHIVGDDYDNPNDRFYGNNDCNGPDSFHGTHCAGIIAAARKNNLGMDGVAADVRIMSVRCVPNGDERDKDVANAIRYAVDNGAKILNMSFGKKFAWDKKVVDDAVKYAESKGVLLMHAAGNDNTNIDEEVHYPCKKYENGKEASNFMDIGALSWKPDEKIVAPFSNYGKKTVDLFSPGVDIYSTTPKNTYKDASGTSMATPVACGVAAVLKSYYPNLTPQQIKKILMKSSIKSYADKKVLKPGTNDEYIKFEDLSRTGGIVNMYEAVKMAQKYAKTKS